MAYAYDPTERVYRADDGTEIGQDAQQDIRDGFAVASERWAENLIVLLAAGRLTLDAFERELRDRQARTFTAQYLLGRGGTGALTDADRETLSAMLVDQAGYARGFATDLADGTLSVEGATNRAKLYFAASTQAQARALGEAWGVTLPHVPGDGSTACRANCNCRIRLEPQDDGTVHVYWVTGSIENCDDCLQRARDYDPLVLTPNSEN